MYPPRYSALLDSPTQAVLAISTNAPLIAFLVGCMSDTSQQHAVNYPHYVKRRLFQRKPFFLLSLPPGELPAWTWKWGPRTFEKTPETVLDSALRARSKLAVSKLAAAERMVRLVNDKRSTVATPFMLQESIYTEKEREARSFASSGYDDARIFEFPYLAQYAEYTDMSYREAADEILLKAQIRHDALARTEFLRLRHFDKLKEANTPEEVAGIPRAFLREWYKKTT